MYQWSLVFKAPKKKRAALVGIVMANSRAVQFLKFLVFKRRSIFIFLIETLCSSTPTNEIKVLLDFNDYFAFDVLGHNGGLALLWWSTTSVQLLNSSSSCIDVEVFMESIGTRRLTGFYGQLDRARHTELWTLSRNLEDYSTLLWVCIGNFNGILNGHEIKEGCDSCNI